MILEHGLSNVFFGRFKIKDVPIWMDGSTVQYDELRISAGSDNSEQEQLNPQTQFLNQNYPQELVIRQVGLRD